MKLAFIFLLFLLVTPPGYAATATIHASGSFVRFDPEQHCERKRRPICYVYEDSRQEAVRKGEVVSFIMDGIEYVFYPDGSVEKIY